jgi:hypothetical protein
MHHFLYTTKCIFISKHVYFYLNTNRNKLLDDIKEEHVYIVSKQTTKY